MGKVLWSRRRMRKKPNKRVSQNQSYQRHHLIRISSCHKTTSKKKTKKRILLKRKLIVKVQLQHAFNSFGKWCSFPQELEAREKITQDTNYLTTHTEERSIRKRKTSPTSMLLVILFYKVPAVFNIFAVKYKSCFPIA